MIQLVLVLSKLFNAIVLLYVMLSLSKHPVQF